MCASNCILLRCNLQTDLAYPALESERVVVTISSDPPQPLPKSKPEPQRATVENAIANASLQRLRSLMTTMCRESPQARSIATRALLTSVPGKPAAKRRVHETCINCHEEYNVDTNYDGACGHHPGTNCVSKATFVLLSVRPLTLS